MAEPSGIVAEPTAGTARIKLWDVPVRSIHWAIVLLMPALWWTGEEGDLTLHKQLGYVMLMLVAFRLFWGFFGSSTARFSSFLKGPRAIVAYASGLFGEESATVVGHNPIGGWSAALLLGLLAAQVAIGLFAQDVDGIESGPLSYLVSYDTADAARGWHHLLFNILLGFIALHVAAILFYLFVKRDNLVGPMVTGSKQVTSAVEQPRFAPLWRAAVGVVLSMALGWWISAGIPH
ncbi:cytochrome b/b6 domain-containing protein [Sphingomonas sp. SUN039]|uniref:cytochrome b/b6 domain-containing protein n=1 Tax=Sphingomonas sp. SUN039 TaxID=2937787 RepID=UPI00216409A5|nr:cytochrome b/b6 domain-containing protein [Sphingomonas sp. SUN039]UVO52602.1 cytochrome b/b6 domain-containing protein [Sphingomonas sp. SUN039]